MATNPILWQTYLVLICQWQWTFVEMMHPYSAGFIEDNNAIFLLKKSNLLGESMPKMIDPCAWWHTDGRHCISLYNMHDLASISVISVYVICAASAEKNFCEECLWTMRRQFQYAAVVVDARMTALCIGARSRLVFVAAEPWMSTQTLTVSMMGTIFEMEVWVCSCW